MQRWRIGNGAEQRLCRRCARANRHVLLVRGCVWLGEERGSGAACDCCRCTDGIADRLGPLRWLCYPFSSLRLGTWPWAARAMRQGK